jgi:hypothetical protein
VRHELDSQPQHITVLGVGPEAGLSALAILDELSRDYALDVQASDHAHSDEESSLSSTTLVEVIGPPPDATPVQ